MSALSGSLVTPNFWRSLLGVSRFLVTGVREKDAGGQTETVHICYPKYSLSMYVVQIHSTAN